MSKRKIDLSDIKENELDKTASFTDLMSRSERRNRKKDLDDIEDMVDERKKNTKDLTIELEKAKKRIDEEKEFETTKTLELTRQLRNNFEEIKEENTKKNFSLLNIIGIFNLLCIGFYLYILIFTNYQDDKNSYMTNGAFIILLVFLFGISIVSNKKTSKFFNILNILAIIAFIIFNILSIY